MHNLRLAFFCLATVIALNSASVEAGVSVDAFTGSLPNPWHRWCLSRCLRIAAYEYEVASGYANKDRGVGWLNWIPGHHQLFRFRLNERLRTLAPQPATDVTIEPNAGRLFYIELTFKDAANVPQLL